jgi:hypothetical protein
VAAAAVVVVEEEEGKKNPWEDNQLLLLVVVEERHWREEDRVVQCRHPEPREEGRECPEWNCEEKERRNRVEEAEDKDNQLVLLRALVGPWEDNEHLDHQLEEGTLKNEKKRRKIDY